MPNNYLTPNGLMKHLRKSNIDINSNQKKILINNGYYHGYKGYRFFKSNNKKLPLSNYSELQSIINYDSALKQLFYGKIMFIETAIKNISLNIIMKEANSNNIEDVYDKLILSYKNCKDDEIEDVKKTYQMNKLKLQNIIHKEILKAYNKRINKITHFYNNREYTYVPIWAIFEILMLGDFGYLISCLNSHTRELISRELKLNLAVDTNIESIYKIIYIIKDLRNAIAHNDIIYDCRFRRTEITKPVKKGITTDTKLNYINFKTIVDYIVLVCYLLKNLNVAKREINSFVTQFICILEDYKKSVSSLIYDKTVHKDTNYKISILKEYIKNK